MYTKWRNFKMSKNQILTFDEIVELTPSQLKFIQFVKDHSTTHFNRVGNKVYRSTFTSEYVAFNIMTCGGAWQTMIEDDAYHAARVNAVHMIFVSWCEGDISLVQCTTSEEFNNQLSLYKKC